MEQKKIGGELSSAFAYGPRLGKNYAVTCSLSIESLGRSDQSKKLRNAPPFKPIALSRERSGREPAYFDRIKT
jgi:hypothetical protein